MYLFMEDTVCHHEDKKVAFQLLHGNVNFKQTNLKTVLMENVKTILIIENVKTKFSACSSIYTKMLK